ncbi:MAG: shikimate dehydrogenase, partial [Akkermansia sp.]|nr:shikimate dehydrogenase [Akkermansia sp.]
PGQLVYDIVTHDTPLRRAAAEQGCLTDNGLAMLLWQGAYAYNYWFGSMPDIDCMRTALQKA